MTYYLQVILTYHYTANGNIRHCCQPIFVRTELHLQDGIQYKIIEIWGILLFPNQINVDEYVQINLTGVVAGLPVF